MVALGCSPIALSVLLLPAAAVPNDYKRDLLGLLHGESTPTPLPPTRVIFPTQENVTRSSSSSFGNPSPSISPSLPIQSTSDPTPWTNSAVSTLIQTTPVSTPSTPPATPESLAIDHSSKTWQIIGITIISVLFIATTIACAIFFDRLWRFLKDVLCCTSRPSVSEEFIPDRGTQSWDAKALSHSPVDYNSEVEASANTRELPWNTDSQTWNTLHREPSRRNLHPPPT